MSERLPIDDVLPALVTALTDSTRAVLHAPPGAGKTTRVPLALLPHIDGRIIMLEPRRLAARAAATWMARTLGESVGDTVGYRVRLDSRISTRTRVEVVTEGVLARMLLDDPGLDGVALVIFDEFHERSIHADTALALTLQVQALLRPDLRLLVLSATLDVDPVVRLLDTAPDAGIDRTRDVDAPEAAAATAPVIRSEGRAWPVSTVYLDRRIEGHIEAAVAHSTVRAHDAHAGDILVFLPGAAEIRRTAEHLGNAGLPAATRVMPLYGDLPQDAQDRAIAPSAPGSRRIVLATGIAETSLTIDGVRVVVDSGLMRVPRFSPRTGMSRLVTVPVSRAAADQRRGRAGRLGPGVCYRMWTEGEHAALLAHRPPEILDADLTSLALELAAWGTKSPAELQWIDPPPQAAYAQALELLRELDAIDAGGSITSHGTAMVALGAHPRIAHMLLESQAMGCAAAACDIAALLEERDILRAHDTAADPDIRLRLPLIHGDTAAPPGHYVDRAALQRVRTAARRWHQRLRTAGPSHDIADECAALLIAFAYPDRLAIRRGGRGSFVLRGGSGAIVDAGFNLAGEEMIVAAELGGHGRSARVFRGVPITRSSVESAFAAHIRTSSSIEYDATAGKVVATETTRLGALMMERRPLHDPDPGTVADALVAAVRRHGAGILSWTRDAESLRARLAFLNHHDPDAWPAVSGDALSASAGEWLPQWLPDSRGDALRRVNMSDVLLSIAGWERSTDIDRLAPTHVQVPSGSRIAIDYSDPAAPILAVRLQEMFGAAETPAIADGRVPLTLHLLSPARRPVQVTRDLASFWQGAYFDVRRDLRGRYPRHYWPDDPLVAEPTRRARPRGR